LPFFLFRIREDFILKLVKEIKPKRIIIYSLIILLGVAIDLVSKILVAVFLKPVGDLPIISDFFHFTYHENPGAAWGMLQDARWVFMTVSTVAIIGLTFYLYTGWVESKLGEAAFLLIISGGIGNMVDRISLGYVIDFLHAKFIDFPIFNIADSFVTVGAFLLIASLIIEIFNEGKRKGQEK
jgi:signal peptidase II